MRWYNSLLAILVVVLTVACSSDGKEGDAATYRRTVIVYMAAQNSLGTTSDAEKYGIPSAMDSAEIAYGTRFLPSTADNLLLFVDDARVPRLYRYFRSADGTGYCQKLKQYASDENSADAATLTDVLREARRACPSKSYALVMWSHGMTWLPAMSSFYGNAATKAINVAAKHSQSFGIDVGADGDMLHDRAADGSIGAQMELRDMATAIKASGVKLDYIFFDACMMQAVEVAYELRDVADYIIGSPALTSGYGAVYYHQMESGFFDFPSTDSSIRSIVDTYYRDVMEDETWTGRYGQHGCVMSVVKTAALEELAAATRPYLEQLLRGNDAVDISDMDGYVSYETTGYPDGYDLGSVMHRLLSEHDYLAWRAVLNRCVVYCRLSDSFYWGSRGSLSLYSETDSMYGCGLSVFIPQEKYTRAPAFLNYNRAIRETAWYDAIVSSLGE